MSFNLNELNLSNSKINSGGRMLEPGRYIVRTKGAQLKDTKKRDGSKAIEVDLVDINGGGSIRAWINVFNVASKEAERIGREQLKSILFFGGHPNPDQPGDISSYNGLEVGISVKATTYTDKSTGQTRTSSDVTAFFDPAELDSTRTRKSTTPKPSVASGAFVRGDDIPF